MRSIHHVLLALVALAAFASPASAQYSKLASLVDTIGRRGDTLGDLTWRQPPDLPAIYAAALQMRDAITSASAAISGFGQPLASAAASPHEGMLKEPFKLASDFVVVLGDSVADCDLMMKLANTAEKDRASDFNLSLRQVGVSLQARGRMRVKDWEQLSRKCDETRRWFYESLKSATSERDRSMQDCRPIEDAQNAAWARLQAAQRADDKADYEHDRALERVVSAEAKENDTYERYRDAVTRGAKSEEASALRQRWAQAGTEQNDALQGAYSALQTHNYAREELSRAYIQLATAQREMRAFTVASNADKIVENYNNFVRWSDLFEREMSR